MGIVGGPRHYTGGKGIGGADITGPTGWKCPTCRADNISIIAEGCPVCGAGSQAQAQEAASRTGPTASPEQIARAVLGQPTATPDDLAQVRLCFSPVAQLTLARALAHYAEHGSLVIEGEGAELPRLVILGWARLMDPPETAKVRQE